MVGVVETVAKNAVKIEERYKAFTSALSKASAAVAKKEGPRELAMRLQDLYQLKLKTVAYCRGECGPGGPATESRRLRARRAGPVLPAQLPAALAAAGVGGRRGGARGGQGGAEGAGGGAARLRLGRRPAAVRARRPAVRAGRPGEGGLRPVAPAAVAQGLARVGAAGRGGAGQPEAGPAAALRGAPLPRLHDPVQRRQEYGNGVGAD